MKSIHYLQVVGLLLFLSGTFTHSLFAQNCTPDTSLTDAPLGLYPTPFDAAVFPEGGLATFPATIGMPYELTFTVKLTDSVNISPFNFDLNSFALDNSDAILGLPLGLDYACNPPNCVFPDSVLGCIIISGTPIEANLIGDYNLQFQGQLIANEDDSINFDFPSTAIPGEYILTLNRSENVDTDGDEIMDNVDNCVNIPNPDQTDMDLDGAGAGCDCDDTSETGASCVLGCQPFYLDEDGDGFGTPMDSVIACTAPVGYVSNKLDCDDENIAANPNAEEIFSNGFDDNCNGLIDERLTPLDTMGMEMDTMDMNTTGMNIDLDEDGIIDSLDNCLGVANPNQIDVDGDGVGAACDCDDTELIGLNCSDGCLTFYANPGGDIQVSGSAKISEKLTKQFRESKTVTL